jgi:hypothetical protein
LEGLLRVLCSASELWLLVIEGQAAVMWLRTLQCLH